MQDYSFLLADLKEVEPVSMDIFQNCLFVMALKTHYSIIEFLWNILQKLYFSVAGISLAHKVLELLNHIITGLSLTWNTLKKVNKTGVWSTLKENKTNIFVGTVFMKDFDQLCDWSLF